MSNRTIRGLALRAASASAVAAGVLLAGCGESEPPPISKEAFQEQKTNQEIMLKKEYGLDRAKAK